MFFGSLHFSELYCYIPRTGYSIFLSLRYRTYFIYSKLKNEQSCPRINLPLYFFFNLIYYMTLRMFLLCLATSYSTGAGIIEKYSQYSLLLVLKLSPSLSNSVQIGNRRTADLCLYAEYDIIRARSPHYDA